MPTIMAQLGEPDLKEQLLTSYTAGDKTFKRIHLDGYDQSALITGDGPTKRKKFFYFTETTLNGVRYGDYKLLFKEQDRWFNGARQDFVIPQLVNLKLDPFERFTESRGYETWLEDRSWMFTPALGLVADLVKSLEEYPPRMRSFDFDIDEMLKTPAPH